MKKIILTLSIFSLTLSAYCQAVQPTQTLFSEQLSISGWFVEVPLTLTQINQENVFSPGLAGGIILNNHLRLGLSGNDYSQDFNRIEIQDADQGRGAYLEGNEGALLIEPVIGSDKLVHLTFPIQIGGGRAELDSKSLHPDEDGEMEEMDLAKQTYFMLKPGAMVEINLHPYVRLALGASYRWTNALDMQDVEADALRGFSGSFSLRIGKF